ncbi:pleiotropic regulatory protein RsmS [Marinomonas sp. A79]|uniref:Pleiotropic regulatory protein RsmS n=1 Tax=Marinomonas vulgaris TaxID=2823372 RepID=A0ABS5H9A0_9GAMM|nr:pleiotropic regulatory protein RsmS [Marinomonas vulgaris]MBR7888271.1 pleiotropic regulatory protein RsmS [Marinomonas vulgaris]
MSLDQAPEHIKLAVDLIELLEENNIAPSVAVDALTIVLRDFQQKLESIDSDDSK